MSSIGKKLKFLKIYICSVSIFIPLYTKVVFAAHVHDYEVDNNFDYSFMKGDESNINKFLSHGTIVPGDYRLDIYLNKVFISTENIRFIVDGNKVQPCLKRSFLEGIGVNIPLIVERFGEYKGNEQADELQCIIPAGPKGSYIDWEYDGGEQVLSLSLPQVFLSKVTSQGYTSPELWDEGETAFFSSYNINGQYGKSYGAILSNYSLNLNSGFNLGLWRFRNQSVYTSSRSEQELQSLRTYAERDLTSLVSRLSVGEIYGRSEVFDSPSLRGMQVRSDDSMLPDDLRGYSPVVTGTANSNALIEIRQGGSLVYTESVAPGPFVIRNIPTYGSNGDLEITIIEADGTQRVQTQGFGMLPVMIKEGQFRYQASFGQLTNEQLDLSDRWYLSTDGAFGLFSNATIYGGMQGMKNYAAANAGIGIGTRFGSLSFDVTHSDSKTAMGNNKGESYRFRFGRVFHDAGTTLALAGYRYATEDYRSLDDHIREYSRIPGSPYASRVRSNVSLSISQQLPSDWGGLNVAASEQDYWDKMPVTRSLSASYGNFFGPFSYSVGIAQSKNSFYGNDTLTSLSISLPLRMGKQSQTLSYSGNYGSQYDHSGITLSGQADTNNYNLSANTDHHGNKSFAGALSTYSAYGDGGVNYSHGADYDTVNANWRGSVVAHAGGVNVGQPIYDGLILVETPGLAGAKLEQSEASTGENGFAIVNTVNPYRRNTVSIDSKSLPAGVEVSSGMASVVPRKGSVSHVQLHTEEVFRIQFALIDGAGMPLPFGTLLESVDGELLSIADNNGRALALLKQPKGELVIGGEHGCRVHYDVTQLTQDGYYLFSQLKCDLH